MLFVLNHIVQGVTYNEYLSHHVSGKFRNVSEIEQRVFDQPRNSSIQIEICHQQFHSISRTEQMEYFS